MTVGQKNGVQANNEQRTDNIEFPLNNPIGANLRNLPVRLDGAAGFYFLSISWADQNLCVLLRLIIESLGDNFNQPQLPNQLISSIPVKSKIRLTQITCMFGKPIRIRIAPKPNKRIDKECHINLIAFKCCWSSTFRDFNSPKIELAKAIVINKVPREM
jgi:hypothetical protein